jgi:leader peptidase (prepilin peptidase)/N-methyltransferase
MSEEIIWLFNLSFFAVGLFCLLLGLAVGSFLNVCIWRLPREESIIRPGSHCPVCSAALGVRDLVPVLSWIFLRGKCRFCGARISPRYPAVELLTGGLFLVTTLHYGPGWEMIVAMVFSAFMVAITFIDLDHQIILDGMLALLAASGLALQLATGAVGFWSMWIGALAGGGLLLVLAIISRGGMGGGDVKFAAALGFWLGWPEILLGLFIGFVSGGLISLLLLVTGLRGRKDFIPFGPFIALGAWLTLLYGKQILAWYFSFLI